MNTPGAPPAITEAPRTGYVAEIEGVRGLALTLVVLFHLFGQGRVSGGVDVFLLISGFLLTRSIVRRAAEKRGPFLATHFGRVLVRLVPSAFVVLVFTLLATIALSPPSTWAQTGRELVASALYYENWELISSQLAYGAAGPTTSPLQHFWSLSVQGQFFLVWPFVIVVLAGIARRAGKSLHRWVMVFAVVTTVASFAYAVFLTELDQQVAYFSSFTRFWELGAGAVLALVAGRIALPEAVRVVMGWLGLAMIVSCGFFIDGAQEFPGVPTLWPITGVALVILSSGAATRLGPDRALQWSPLRFLARISYPLYLWHWPILIFYVELRDQKGIGFVGAVVVLTASIVLAWLTQRYVAEPAFAARGRIRPRAAILTSAACLVLFSTVVAGGVWRVETARAAELAAASADSPNHPGALALTEAEPMTWDVTVPFRPATDAAFGDLPDLYSRKCVQNWRSEPGMDKVFECPDLTAKNSRKRVVMSGGSHVLHWYPALKAVAEQQNWELIVVDKDGCRLTLRDDDGDGLSEMCHSWNDKALPYIIDLHPDALFTVATKTPETPGAVELSYPGQVGSWAKLADAGIPVIAVRDTPRFLEAVPQCVEKHAPNVAVCGRDRSEVFADRDLILDDATLPDGTALLDLSDAFCDAERCEPIVGNVLAYRDQDHMTATYSRTLAPALLEALRTHADWLF